MLERAGGGEDGDANDVEHEERDALQIDDEDLAGERGDDEEEEPRKKIWTTRMEKKGWR